MSGASLALVTGGLICLAFIVRSFLEARAVPALVGYIGLGFALSAADQQWPFLDSQAEAVFELLGNIGIVALLFRVGVESDLAGLWRKVGQSVPVWLGSVAVSGVAAFSTAYYLLSLDWMASLFIGVAATATSVGVSVSVWQDCGAIHSENGQRLLDVAEMDDISGVALLALLLAVVPVWGQADGSVAAALGETAVVFALKFAGFGLFCFVLSRFAEKSFTRYWQRRLTAADLTVLVAALGVMIAATSEFLGLSLAIGALFAGFVFSRDSQNVEDSHAYRALLDVFAPFFFIAIGLKFDLTAVGEAVWLAVPLFIVAVVGKFVGTALPALRPAGKAGAVLIGVSMVPRAEITMIIAQRGREAGYLDNAVFGALLVVSLATSIVAPAALQRLLRRWPQGS